MNEQRRLDTPSATITDHIVLSRKYFAEAVRLAPDDWRFKGFLASMELAEGALHGDEKLTRQGYFNMMQSIKGWPEFNLFTAGYVMSRLPVDDGKYADGVEYQWQTLDACAEETVDRRTAQYDKYMAKETTTGIKRPCWNSWIAPHYTWPSVDNAGAVCGFRQHPDMRRSNRRSSAVSIETAPDGWGGTSEKPGLMRARAFADRGLRYRSAS